ncbi:MAG: tRNA uridine-5-carboxymethylaminomethyl(34) synthesis GTPase MnmE [Hydrogenibacillus schlegelii]|nr:tRNA uridine-5-carboxymethylaminomethyl(34) synthesis GTPase MnmE [Hydrogenibacillus schlegelii]
MRDDTIAAIATPPGEGGVAIVRLSGPEAIAIADRVFRGRTPLRSVESHRLVYGHLVDPATKAVLDEVLVGVMRRPRSFTREDVVELNVHGGRLVARRALELVLKEGARLAEPGEFTLRAFLNGRIDLAQAEATLDVIRAETEAALLAAGRALRGAFGEAVRAVRAALLRLVSRLEVAVDYPEYDEPDVTRAEIAAELEALLGRLRALRGEAALGRLLRDGVPTAIVGRPNAGKSSLFNALAGEERAIVTDVPGTTRDVLEVRLVVGDVVLRLVDTAGIRRSDDPVEAIGIERARKALREASLVLAVVDGARPLSPEDEALLAELRERSAIVVLNKSDLPSVVTPEAVAAHLPSAPVVRVSARTGEGLPALRAAILRVLGLSPEARPEAMATANARHLAALDAALEAVGAARRAAGAGAPEDAVLVDLRQALRHLGAILGEDVDETVIRTIFSDFCVGK